MLVDLRAPCWANEMTRFVVCSTPYIRLFPAACLSAAVLPRESWLGDSIVATLSDIQPGIDAVLAEPH